MKKILFVVESMSGGGAEKVLFNIVKNLDKKKYAITVYTVVKTGVYINELQKYCNIKYGLKNYQEYSFLGKLFYKLKYRFIYSANTKIVYKFLIRCNYDIEIGFVEGFSTKLVANSLNKKSIKICL